MQNSKWMRFLLITLSVVMVLSLFACGDNGSTTEETTVDNTEDTTVEDTTVEDTTVEDTTVEDTTVEDTTVEDTTVEDTTVEDTTVEDTTVEDTTVEDDVVIPGEDYAGVWITFWDEISYATKRDFSDKQAVPSAAANYTLGNMPVAPVEARFFTFGGWGGVSGEALSAVAIKLYAEDGTLLETIALNKDAPSGSRFYESEPAVKDELVKFGCVEETVGYRMYAPVVDLAEYENQTVTAVLELAIEGKDAVVAALKLIVTVPEIEDEPEETTAEGYVSGTALSTGVVADHLDSVVNDDGSLTVTSKGGTDNNIQLMAFAPATAPKYAVIKYKTSNSSKFELFVTTTSGTVGPNVPVALTADGKWHVVVISLADSTACTVGEAITFLRLDCCESGSTSESLTIDYIWFLDDPSVIDEPVKYNIASRNNVDFVYADGNEDANLKASAAIEATTVKYVGWLGVAKSSASGISYVVTDANGVETSVALEASEEATNRYYAGGDDIQNAVANLGDGTVGYIVKFTADLSEWAGQTVTLSIAVTTPGGVVGETYSVVVNVPAAQ